MTIDCNTPGRATSRLVLGVAVMLLGLALTLDNFGLFEFRHVLRLWPLLLIAVGLARLSQTVRYGGNPEGHVLALVGLGFLLMNFGVIRFGQALALFMLAVGGVMVWRAARTGQRSDDVAADVNDRVDAFALLGGVQRKSRSSDFRGGNASAALGGCDIDLREASILEGQTAVFDTLALMGGIEIRVPEDWSVETRGVAMLGGFEDKTRRPLDDRKKLVVTGLALLGGIEVKN